MGPSPPPAWSLTEEQARESRLWRFMQALGCSSYPELCQKAAEDAKNGCPISGALKIPVTLRASLA